MTDVERERSAEVNRRLSPKAFEEAWRAFQNTPIDLVSDSDDETCKCVHNAIVTYLEATGRIQIEDQYRVLVSTPLEPK